MKWFALLLLVLATTVHAQSSMRRCTVLPVTDSVGGAIGFKVFQEVERELKGSNWCTYVSNSGLISVFSRYRENLPQHLKSKEVLSTVAEKLKVGSLIRIALISEVNGLEVQLDVFGENGEDLYFSEKTFLQKDDIEIIAETIKNWLDMYARTIPYDAQVMGILGDQLTLDVGKGYPIREGQKFIVKRALGKKKHPLLKKIVDWETEVLAEGSVFTISDNQALGMVKIYKGNKKLAQGDWIRLEEFKQAVIKDPTIDDDNEKLGTLGVLSLALFGTSSSIDTTTDSGTRRLSGNLYGIDFRLEGWITRQYFAAFELSQALGSMNKKSGTAEKDQVTANSSSFKLTGGYKYLPIGFFYGPQIDLYGGYANQSMDIDVSERDGYSKTTFSGLVVGTAANVPLNREFRIYARGEFLPFPTFKDDDGVFGSAKSASSMELELGLKYQYTVRMTLDGSVETQSRKAKFSSSAKEVSIKDNILKFGASFNF